MAAVDYFWQEQLKCNNVRVSYETQGTSHEKCRAAPQGKGTLGFPHCRAPYPWGASAPETLVYHISPVQQNTDAHAGC